MADLRGQIPFLDTMITVQQDGHLNTQLDIKQVAAFIILQSSFGKGVGTSPKVRGPVKLRSPLEWKLTPLRHISTQILACLVLVNRFPYTKMWLIKKGKIVRTILAERRGGHGPRGPSRCYATSFGENAVSIGDHNRQGRRAVCSGAPSSSCMDQQSLSWLLDFLRFGPCLHEAASAHHGIPFLINGGGSRFLIFEPNVPTRRPCLALKATYRTATIALAPIIPASVTLVEFGLAPEHVWWLLTRPSN